MPAKLKASRAALGVGAAVALAAAVPAGAIASPHHATASHHKAGSAKHVALKGLVAKHHGRTVTVFAKMVKTGNKAVHHQRVSVTFAHGVSHTSKLRVGDRIHISAMARVAGHQITVLRHNDETVTPAPASLIFGTVNTVDGNQVVIDEQNRDNGDQGSGGDRHDGGDDNGRVSPADHSPGGPGGPGGSGGGNSGHQVVVDISNATVTVDGSTDTGLAAGDSVAVLGEVTNDTIVAADVFGFSTAPAFARGDITAIDGDNVTVGDDNGGDGGDDATPADHGGGGNDDPTLTISLTNVPLALDGDAGASVSDLTVGDKLIVLGSYDATTNGFTAVDAFAFNSNDDNPCGDNGDDNGGDGGSDG